MKKIQKTEKTTIEDLENLNTSDKVAYFLKAIGGAFPYFGSYFAETIVAVIPNQRQDRIIKFLAELDSRLNELPKENIEELIASPKFQALLEESIEQSAKATTQERYEYLASIVIYGISDEKIELEESEYILSLFKQLTDLQIIWLNYYCLRRFGNSDEYFERHNNLLKKKEVYLNASFVDYKQEALQLSNTNHLVRLGLVEEEYEIDNKTKQLVVDSSKKKPKVKDTKITTLGKIVLDHIGIYEDPRELMNKRNEKNPPNEKIPQI